MAPDEAAQPSPAAAHPEGAEAETQVRSLSPRKAAEQCAVCQACDAKYTCPRCSTRSCSAACVTRHKASSGCSGKREVTAFTPIADMTDATLRSDLVLLEDTERLLWLPSVHEARGRRGRVAKPARCRRRRPSSNGCVSRGELKVWRGALHACACCVLHRHCAVAPCGGLLSAT